MQSTEWRDVPEFEGLYEVSDDGQVRRSIKARTYGPGRIMKTRLTDQGYPQVSLSKNGRGKLVKIHRLVAKAFLGEPEPGMMVCHANGIRTDNRVSNLRWGSASDNARDSVTHGTNSFLGRKPEHCVKGHPFDAVNTYVEMFPNGVVGRRCRICRSNRARESERRSRANRQK